MGVVPSRPYYEEETISHEIPHPSQKNYPYHSKDPSDSTTKVPNTHRTRKHAEPTHSDYPELKTSHRTPKFREEPDEHARKASAQAWTRRKDGHSHHRHQSADKNDDELVHREHKAENVGGKLRKDPHERRRRPPKPKHLDGDELGERKSGERRREERPREKAHLEGQAHENREAKNLEISSRSRPRHKAAEPVPKPYSAQAERSKNRRRSRPKKEGIRVSVTEVPQREPDPRQDCIICTESLPLSSFLKQPPTTACTHPPSVCRSCLRTWLKTSFKTKLWDQLTCPECSAQLEYVDVRRCAPTKLFRKYDELSTKAAMEAIEGFQWCVVARKRSKKTGDEGGKTGGCGSGQVHGLGPKMKCVGCGSVQCVEHGVKWHEGETCREYDYRTDSKIKKAEEQASKEWIKKTAKQCPNCKWSIEKNNGCDHMTCSKCRHEFCWLCLADYDPIRKQGNGMHQEGCQYYVNNA